jgi:hypothetical protein
MLPVSSRAQHCPGGVELWRDLNSGGEVVIHCKRIDEISADEWRNLSPASVAALSKEDRAMLDARRKALGIVLVVSPSQALAPETRQFYESQVAILEAKRQKAQTELDKINRSRAEINEAAAYNGMVIHDLTSDSLSHALSVLAGLLYLGEGTIPTETMEKIKAVLSTARVAANGMASATSEPDSERHALKLLDTVNSLKNLIPATTIGTDPEEWDSIKKATDTFPKLISISERIVNNPHDKSLWTAMAASMDDFIDLAGSLPEVGAPIKTAHSVALLIDTAGSLWYLRHDRYDLREASVGSQTAKRYWVTRLGEIGELENVYKTSLAGAGNPDFEDIH